MEEMKEGRKEEEMGSMHRRMVIIYRRTVVSEWFFFMGLVVMDTCSTLAAKKYAYGSLVVLSVRWNYLPVWWSS